MNPNYTRPIVALALRALSDLAAVPLLVFTKGGPPAAVGPLVAALGVLTAAAAIGLARNSTWARPLVWTTRIADVVAALPGSPQAIQPYTLPRQSPLLCQSSLSSFSSATRRVHPPRR